MKKIVGYASVWTAAPGETVDFKVSTYGPKSYRADLVRVICGDDDPDRGIYREDELAAPFAGEYAGRTQIMRSGSYVSVPSHSSLTTLNSFTVQMWIYPTTPAKGLQGVFAYWDEETSAGFRFVINESGQIAIQLGDGNGGVQEVACGQSLAERRWHMIASTYDAATGEVVVYQESLASPLETARTGSVSGTARVKMPADVSVPILMGALPGELVGEQLHGSCHFNGKLDRPRLTGRVMSLAEIVARAWDPDAQERDPALIAAWDFSREIGTNRIVDSGFLGLHGVTINLPSRGVKGYNWSGSHQDWRQAPHEYGAVHFHDDDHYDARWETDFSYVIPAELKSGIYAARLKAEDDEWYVTFFVRPPKGKATAKLAFLASTATYMAYSNYRWQVNNLFAEVTESFWTTLDRGDAFLQEHPEFGLSTYDTHFDGSGVRYASRLRPVLNMAPKTPLWSFNADTHITGWLEAANIDYDVITDEDLHNEGVGLLDQYSAVVTGSHPEYYTTQMLNGVRSYLSRGGRLAYLGGNGFIWRCAFSPEFPGALELRRAEDGIRYRDEEPGEYYQEFNGEYGGLWRRLGLPPQSVVGVGTVAVGFDISGHYERTETSVDPRAEFIFRGIGSQDRIGDFGILADGAAGSEIDAIDFALGTPRHALVVAVSKGHSQNTFLVPDETGFHHSAMDGLQNPNARADMTFFETPSGGAVFSVGSIAWAASLPHENYQNNVAQISLNVLRRFLDPTPFMMPKT